MKISKGQLIRFFTVVVLMAFPIVALICAGDTAEAWIKAGGHKVIPIAGFLAALLIAALACAPLISADSIAGSRRLRTLLVGIFIFEVVSIPVCLKMAGVIKVWVAPPKSPSGMAQSAPTEIERRPDIEPDAEGTWDVPLRYWYSPRTIDDTAGFVFLTEVASLGPVPQADSRGESELQTGMMRVIELLHPAQVAQEGLAKVKMLSVDGTEGLKLGDRVIVLVDSRPYEGGYVINSHEGECRIGIKLPADDDLDFGPDLQAALLAYLRDGSPGPDKMTPVQREAWLHIDPKGLAELMFKYFDLRGWPDWTKGEE